MSSSTRNCSSRTSSRRSPRTRSSRPMPSSPPRLLRDGAADLPSGPHRHRRDRRARRRLRVRQRTAAAPRLPPPSCNCQPQGDQRRMGRVHRRRRLFDAGAMAQRRLGLGAARRRSRAALLARRRHRVHAGRPPRDRSRRAGRSRQLLRSGRLRPMGRSAPSDRGGMGELRGVRRPHPRQPARQGGSGPPEARRRDFRRRLGMDRKRLSRLPRLRSGRGRGRRV